MSRESRDIYRRYPVSAAAIDCKCSTVLIFHDFILHILCKIELWHLGPRSNENIPIESTSNNDLRLFSIANIANMWNTLPHIICSYLCEEMLLHFQLLDGKHLRRRAFCVAMDNMLWKPVSTRSRSTKGAELAWGFWGHAPNKILFVHDCTWNLEFCLAQF